MALKNYTRIKSTNLILLYILTAAFELYISANTTKEIKNK